jgi:hypothetical protein
MNYESKLDSVGVGVSTDLEGRGVFWKRRYECLLGATCKAQGHLALT